MFKQSDKITAYMPFVRKEINWYYYLFYHLITQNAMVNVQKLYCKTNTKIDITKFKCQIIESLLRKKRLRSSLSNHKLKKLSIYKTVN